jgi:hypothetical protein
MNLLKVAAMTVIVICSIIIFGLGALCVAALIASGKLFLAFFVGLLTIFAALDCIGVFD